MGVERSPSGWARCRLCNTKISKDTYRVYESKSAYFGTTYWYFHMRCYATFKPNKLLDSIEKKSELSNIFFLPMVDGDDVENYEIDIPEVDPEKIFSSKSQWKNFKRLQKIPRGRYTRQNLITVLKYASTAKQTVSIYGLLNYCKKDNLLLPKDIIQELIIIFPKLDAPKMTKTYKYPEGLALGREGSTGKGGIARELLVQAFHHSSFELETLIPLIIYYLKSELSPEEPSKSFIFIINSLIKFDVPKKYYIKELKLLVRESLTYYLSRDSWMSDSSVAIEILVYISINFGIKVKIKPDNVSEKYYLSALRILGNERSKEKIRNDLKTIKNQTLKIKKLEKTIQSYICKTRYPTILSAFLDLENYLDNAVRSLSSEVKKFQVEPFLETIKMGESNKRSVKNKPIEKTRKVSQVYDLRAFEIRNGAELFIGEQVEVTYGKYGKGKLIEATTYSGTPAAVIEFENGTQETILCFSWYPRRKLTEENVFFEKENGICVRALIIKGTNIYALFGEGLERCIP